MHSSFTDINPQVVQKKKIMLCSFTNVSLYYIVHVVFSQICNICTSFVYFSYFFLGGNFASAVQTESQLLCTVSLLKIQVNSTLPNKMHTHTKIHWTL